MPAAFQRCQSATSCDREPAEGMARPVGILFHTGPERERIMAQASIVVGGIMIQWIQYCFHWI